MSRESRRLAAILLIVFPTVIFGGISILTMLIRNADGYTDNPLRQDLWRAGHAHAGVLLVLSLLILRYVDEAQLAPAPNTSRASPRRLRPSCCRWRSFCQFCRKTRTSRTI